MRRLFIIRKDLHLSPGKLAAMVGHCCEAYWTNLLKNAKPQDCEYAELPAEDPTHPGQVAFYKAPEIYDAAKKAFDASEKTFKFKRDNPRQLYCVKVEIPKDIWDGYVNGIFTKTICEAKNRNQLMKAKTLAEENNLVFGVDFGLINDKCLTELTPENEDGTCTVGIWFKPLNDEIAHKISKKYKLYKD